MTTTVWIIDFRHYPSNLVCDSKETAINFVQNEIRKDNGQATNWSDYNGGNLVKFSYIAQPLRSHVRIDGTIYGTAFITKEQS